MSAPAPLFGPLADGPEGGHAVWLRTTDGVRIRAACWPGGERGTVVLLPGRTEYIEKYGRAARDLASRGWATATLDWRGQGLADRALPDAMAGHVGSFAEYRRDLDAVLGWIAGTGLPGPLMLLSHSMGGCIALRALHGAHPFRAAVFSAPMWGLVLPPLLRPLAGMVASLVHPLRLDGRYAPTTSAQSYVATAPFEGNLLTGDRAMWQWMGTHLAVEPGLALGGPSLGWLAAALDECAALARLPAPVLPALTFCGSRESIVDPRAIARRMASWPRGELEILPGIRHEVMMEDPNIRRHFFDRACRLFDAHAGLPRG